MTFRGVDVRETGDRILYRALLQDSDGAIVTSGTTTLKLYELQNDGTLKSFDFSDNTFKTTALTTETQALTHRQGNNSTTNTGLWTWAQTTLTGFTFGNIYFAVITNSGASPTVQIREFMYGGTGDYGVVFGTVETGTTAASTTAFSSSITEATTSHYIRGVVIFLSGALAGQRRAVSAYFLVSGEGRFTVEEMTDTPVDGDLFIFV